LFLKHAACRRAQSADVRAIVEIPSLRRRQRPSGAPFRRRKSPRGRIGETQRALFPKHQRGLVADAILSMLDQVTPNDLPTLGMAVVVLCAAATIASGVPAWRVGGGAARSLARRIDVTQF